MALSDYTKKTWADRNVQYPHRYTVTKSGGGTISSGDDVTMTASPGTITEAGSDVNASNLQNIENQVDTLTDDLITASYGTDTDTSASVTALTSSTLTAPFKTALLNGRSVVNILGSAGDCESTSSWGASNCTLTTDSSNEIFSSNCIKIALTDTLGIATTPIDSTIDVDIKASAYYFYSAYVKNYDLGTGLRLAFYDDVVGNKYTSYSTSTSWSRIGMVKEIPVGSTSVSVSVQGAGTSGQYGYIEGVQVIEITATEYALGASAMLLKYPYHNDMKHSDKCRVKSVGKNLFDKSRIKQDYYINGYTGVETSYSGADYSHYINVEPSTTYVKTEKCSTTSVAFYDANKNFMSGATADTYSFTTPAGCYFCIINITHTLLDTTQLEKGSSATTYEPYTETTAIVPVTLRSVSDSICDTFNALSGLHTQNVAIDTDVSSTQYDSQDNTTYTNVDVIKTTAFSNAVAGTTAADGFTRVIDKNNKTLEEVAQADIDLAASAGKYYYHTDNTVWFIVAAGTYADIAAARTGLGTSQVIYQLATPIQTNYFSNAMASHASGTIIVEPYIEDVGVYNSGITIADSNYPISSLEYVSLIDTDTGDLTPISLSLCTVSAGGTSFTISSASTAQYYKYGYTYIGLSSLPALTYAVSDSTNGSITQLTATAEQLDKKIEQKISQDEGIITDLKRKIERYGASSGGTDTYAVSNTNPTFAYYTGMIQTFKADVANTGTASLNVDSLGAKTLKKITTQGIIALQTGDIIANGFYTCVYDGTDFLIFNVADVWELIDDTTLGDTTAQVDITIPSQYKRIKVIGDHLLSNSSTGQLLMRCNSDSGNNYHSGVQTVGTSNNYTSQSSCRITNSTEINSSTICAFELSIDNLQTQYKMYQALTSTQDTNYKIHMSGGAWLNNSNQISTLSFLLSANSFAANSRFRTFGMR